MRKINIIQTINYIESEEHLDNIFKLLSETSINGLRINICKYSQDEIEKIVTVLSNYANINKICYPIIIDLPFPKNKSRILETTIQDGIIKKNQRYYLVKDKSIYNKLKNNSVLIDCDEFDKNLETIYYGDGEGGFKVINQKENVLELVALNSFYIIKGKSILCGYKTISLNLIRDIVYKLCELDIDISFLLSFIENAEEVESLIEYIDNKIRIYPKFETNNAIKNYKFIIDKCSGALIARGDLAIKTPIRDLYKNISKICEYCSQNNKRLIFCTDILNNLQSRLIPERSELMDLLGIIKLGGTDIILPGDKKFNYNNIKTYFNQSIEQIENKINIIRKCE